MTVAIELFHFLMGDDFIRLQLARLFLVLVHLTRRFKASIENDLAAIDQQEAIDLKGS